MYEDGQQRRNFVHVHDVAEAVVAATMADLPLGASTAMNIGTAEIHTVGRMAELMSAAVGGPPPVTTGQYRLGDVRHITADSSKAVRVLGWSSRIRLEDGIADLVHSKLERDRSCEVITSWHRVGRTLVRDRRRRNPASPVAPRQARRRRRRPRNPPHPFGAEPHPPWRTLCCSARCTARYRSGV